MAKRPCCDLNVRLHRDNAAGKVFALCGVCDRIWETKPSNVDRVHVATIDGVPVELVFDDGEGEYGEDR